MNLIKCFQTHSTWYKGAKRGSTPVGILWHDTAGGNPSIARYVQPYEGDADYDKLMALLGKNKYNNDWNHIDHEAGLNAWIGKLADGSIATVQAGEWNIHPWGCGGGTAGSCNGYIKKDGKTTWTNEHWIQFEICDDNYGNGKGTKEYFDSVYKEACEFTAYICKLYNIDPKGTYTYNGVKVPTILCHADSYQLKMGGNHGDIYSWFKAVGLPRSMDNVRNDVAKILAENITIPVKEETPAVLDYSVFKKGTLVSIIDNATYYSGKSIPSWVKNQNWYVYQDATSSRVVVNESENGSNSIMSPIDARYLTIVKKAETTISEVVEPVKTSYNGIPSTGSEADEKVIWNFLLSKLENEFGVAGLMGNLCAESALISNNLQNSYEKKLGYTNDTYTKSVDNGSYTNFVHDSAGYGLAQWTYWSRKENLLNFAQLNKKSIGDLTMQLEFLYKELSKGYKKSTLLPLTQATSVLEASNIVLLQFEKPASKDSAKTQAKRASYGQTYYDKYHTVIENPAEEELVTIPEETPPIEDIETPISEINQPIDEPIIDTVVDDVPESSKEQTTNILQLIINFIKMIIDKLTKKS